MHLIRQVGEYFGTLAPKTYLYQRLSFEVKRENAASVVGACNISDHLYEMLNS